MVDSIIISQKRAPTLPRLSKVPPLHWRVKHPALILTSTHARGERRTKTILTVSRASRVKSSDGRLIKQAVRISPAQMKCCWADDGRDRAKARRRLADRRRGGPPRGEDSCQGRPSAERSSRGARLRMLNQHPARASSEAAGEGESGTGGSQCQCQGFAGP